MKIRKLSIVSAGAACIISSMPVGLQAAYAADPSCGGRVTAVSVTNVDGTGKSADLNVTTEVTCTFNPASPSALFPAITARSVLSGSDGSNPSVAVYSNTAGTFTKTVRINTKNWVEGRQYTYNISGYVSYFRPGNPVTTSSPISQSTHSVTFKKK